MTLAHPLMAPRTPSPPRALAEALERHGVRMRLAREEGVYRQGEPVEHLYRVMQGAVRTTRVTVEGRRQIGDFYYAGDIFGLEPGPDHQFSAEAMADGAVQLVRRSAVRAFAGDVELDRAILEATRLELRRAQAHALLLGRKNAREKVAGFLMSLACSDAGGGEVPMGRQDIADYLGLTIETVSRTLTQLQGKSIVEFPSLRRFRVKHWPALEALAA